MEDSQINNDSNAEIVPFIGIPRKWANLTLKVYSLIFLGYAIWVAYQEFVVAAKTFKAKMTFLVSHLGAFSVFEAITIVSFIQVLDIIMYLTNKFRTDVEKIKAQSEAIGEARGRAEGRTDAYQVWEEWLRRQEDAKAQGRPFDEPPPSLNGDRIKR